MECLLGISDESCFVYDELKCSVHDKKDKLYETCMLRVQRKYGKEMRDFCTQHYIDSNVYDSTEKTKLEFVESYHNCREEAGVKKNKEYC
jgi:hypothetical protein